MGGVSFEKRQAMDGYRILDAGKVNDITARRCWRKQMGKCVFVDDDKRWRTSPCVVLVEEVGEIECLNCISWMNSDGRMDGWCWEDVMDGLCWDKGRMEGLFRMIYPLAEREVRWRVAV